MANAAANRLWAKIIDMTWDTDDLSALARSYADSDNDRANIDAVAPSERLWDECEELRSELRSLRFKAA